MKLYIGYLLFFLSPLFVYSGNLRKMFNSEDEILISKLQGSYVQAFSSRYVHETSEIDNSCIHVEISTIKNSDNKYQAFIKKKAILHASGNLINTTNDKYNISNNHNGILEFHPYPQISSIKSKYLNLHYVCMDENQELQCLLLTSSDNLSSFVFAKNFTDFEIHYKKPVLNTFIKLNFTGYYKSPLYSYSESCL